MTDESQNARDARLEKLWKSLHNGPVRPLDLEGLRAGLEKIGHRMLEPHGGNYFCQLTFVIALGTADKLLKEVFDVVDTSKDGKIEYSGKSYQAWSTTNG